jgi:peptidoglycan/LPS O-acetylase OafA/YrhL
MMDLEVHDLKYLRQWSSPLSIVILLLGLLLGSFPDSTREYLGSFYGPWFLPMEQCANFYHSIGAILLIAAVNNMPGMQKMLEAKACTFLGRISFSMYLLHSLVLGSVILFAFLYIYPSLGYGVTVLLLFPVYLALTFFCSYFFARYVDEKSTGISKSIYLQFFKK